MIGKIFKVLVIIGIFLISYFYGFRLLTAEAVNTEKRLDEAEQFYGKLLQKAANSEYYQEEINRMEQEFDEVLASYRTSLSQEEDIVFLYKLERQTGVTIKDVSFTKENTVYQFDRDSMPSQYNVEQSKGNLFGISATITIYFEGTYEQMKKLIVFTEQYENYMVLSSLETNFQRETGIVEGTAIIRRYAITGADREPEEANLPAVSTGTANIFGEPLPPVEETIEEETTEAE